MKKLNNKGFAVSTVIYGLSIMAMLLVLILMGNVASIRTNTKEMVSSIEDELNSFSRSESSFSVKLNAELNPEAQAYTVPEGQTGFYRIELWGASGELGARGAYTSGIIYLEEGEVLYFYVGQDKTGQETDVRVLNGDYLNHESYETRIMVAAGGGRTSEADGGTLASKNIRTNGGQYDSVDDYKLKDSSLTLVRYANPDIIHTTRVDPTPELINKKGDGGDGYVDGSDSIEGGISFISGYAGCHAYVKGAVISNPLYTYYEAEYQPSTNSFTYVGTGKNYLFYDGYMAQGVNEGAGRAKIERITSGDMHSISDLRKNTNLDSVSTIEVSIGENADKISIHAIQNGERVGFQECLGKSSCKITGLGAKKLDEIGVFLDPIKDYTYYSIKINGSIEVKQAKSVPTTETPTGTHISAYQPDYTQELSNGTYYVMPILTDNRVISAFASSDVSDNALLADFISGASRQKWKIEKVNERVKLAGEVKVYKLVESVRNKTLTLDGSEVKANSAFDSFTRQSNQIWKIEPVGDGTYTIENAETTGFLVPNATSSFKIVRGGTNTETQRFRFISVDYSK